MWSQTKGFDVWWVITLRTFLQAINHLEKDKWRRLFQLQTIQYFPKPGVGVRQVQGLAQTWAPFRLVDLVSSQTDSLST